MMKRYDYVRDCMADCFCDIEEKEEGRYVEYDEIMELLRRLASDSGLDKDCMYLIIDALAE